MCLAIGSTTPPSNHPLHRLLRRVSGNPFAMLGIGALLYGMALPWRTAPDRINEALWLTGLAAQPVLGLLFWRLPVWYRQSPVEYLGYMLLLWAWLAAAGCALAGWQEAAVLLGAAGWWQAWRVLRDLTRWIPEARERPARVLRWSSAVAGMATLGMLSEPRFIALLALTVIVLTATTLLLAWSFARDHATMA